MSIFLKIIWSFPIMRFKQERQIIHPPCMPSSSPSPHPTVEKMKEETLNFCLQRLQRLEILFREISSRHAQMPIDQELMLQESWQRLKLVELDLEKTKKALHATVAKQMQTAELLEALQSKQSRRRCC